MIRLFIARQFHTYSNQLSSMPSLINLLLPVASALALALPTVAKNVAPPASCYTDNANSGVEPITDPDTIAEGTDGWLSVCNPNQITKVVATIPAGYSASFQYSSSDNAGLSPLCTYVHLSITSGSLNPGPVDFVCVLV